jgi:hypothetical protein
VSVTPRRQCERRRRGVIWCAQATTLQQAHQEVHCAMQHTYLFDCMVAAAAAARHIQKPTFTRTSTLPHGLCHILVVAVECLDVTWHASFRSWQFRRHTFTTTQRRQCECIVQRSVRVCLIVGVSRVWVLLLAYTSLH